VRLETETIRSATVTRFTKPIFADKQDESNATVRFLSYLVVFAN
jgi:hypothetical protein